MRGFLVSRGGTGIAIDLQQDKGGRVSGFTQYIESRDPRFLNAGLCIRERRFNERVFATGFHLHVYVDDKHSDSYNPPWHSVYLDAYAAFRIRDYRYLLASTAFSNFGVQMLSVAVSWDLFQQTHSALVLGNVGLAQVAPSFAFAILAGHIADKYDRRRTMLLAQCLSVLGSLLLVLGVHNIAGIYSCLFLVASARTFQWPIRLGVLPDIMPPEVLSNAISWNATVFETSGVVGPALAGFILAAAGTRTIYAIQFGCSLAALLCFSGLSFERRPRPEADEALESKSALEGLRFIRDNKLILTAVSLDLFAVLFGGAVALLPIYTVDILHAGPRAFGWLRTAPSIGAILMALRMAHSRPVKRAGATMLWCVAGYGLATIGFGLSRVLWFSFVMLLLTGALDNVSVVLRQLVLQTRTPDYVRGRVMAVNSIFINCSNQLGAVESGWAAAAFGPVFSAVSGGVAAVAVVAACAFLSPALRKWQQ